MGYLLGIDLGTSKIKADIYDTKGIAIGGSSREINMILSHHNWREQDPENWWVLLKSILNEISSKTNIGLKQIEGIGICGQSHGPTPLNKRKEFIGPCITWMDQRCTEQLEWISKKVGKERVLNITGLDVDIVYTAAKILWIKENQPEIYEKAEMFLLPKDVLVFKLTGNYSTDITDASVTNLFDIETQDWSKEIFKELGIPLNKFPHINRPEKVVGEVTETIAKETGLQKGVPVIAGGADWAINYYGTGGVKPNLAIDMSGTVGDLIVTIHKDFNGGGGMPSIVPEIKILRVATLKTAASLFQWGRDEFCISEQYLSKKLNKTAFELMDKEVKEIIPGSNGVFVFPHFEGQRNPGNPNLKGVIFGLSINTKREEILRAILEGVAYEYRKGMESLLQAKDIKCAKIFTSGGGARSDIWNQIKADIIGIPYCKLNIKETGTFGAAMLAGVGIGLFNDLKDPIEQFNKIKKIYEPNKKSSMVYNRHYVFYKEFTKVLHENNVFSNYSDLVSLREI